jgi:hypothetical protein
MVQLPVADGLTLKIIVLCFKFNFFLRLIFTHITYHFVADNVTTDICQINQQNISGCSVANSGIIAIYAPRALQQ